VSFELAFGRVWEYKGGMKEKTSITLSSDLLADIDRLAGTAKSRSAFIEGILREYFKERVRQALNQRDLELINANIDYLNSEVEDVLQYQAPIDFSGTE
jgi:metal-responsive CopG/Arc/MetJ family transcriptional regulator